MKMEIYYKKMIDLDLTLIYHILILFYGYDTLHLDKSSSL